MKSKATTFLIDSSLTGSIAAKVVMQKIVRHKNLDSL